VDQTDAEKRADLFRVHLLRRRDLIAHEIPYENGSDKQSRTAFRGRLRPNACIQPQCQCHSQSSSSDDQRSGWWHDSNIARGGPRRAWFGATLPVEVTLAFKLGLKWSFKRTATHRNALRLAGQWSRGSSAGSAGNLVVSRTETWIFSDDLTYESKYESYEGYVSPFGGGYSVPKSVSTPGIWAPSDVPTSPFSIILIDESGDFRNATVEWTAPEQMFSPGMLFNGERFGRM
jgi:hypothetical protein